MTDYYLLAVKGHSFVVLDVKDSTAYAYTEQQIKSALSTGIFIGFLDEKTMTMAENLVVNYKYEERGDIHIIESYLSGVSNSSMYHIYSRKRKDWTILEKVPFGYEENGCIGEVKVKDIYALEDCVVFVATAHLPNYYRKHVGADFSCLWNYQMGQTHYLDDLCWIRN